MRLGPIFGEDYIFVIKNNDSKDGGWTNDNSNFDYFNWRIIFWSS